MLIGLCDLCFQVTQTNGGVSLTKEGHKEVAQVAQELQKYCVEEPVKCPLIFGGIPYFRIQKYYLLCSFHLFSNLQFVFSELEMEHYLLNISL